MTLWDKHVWHKEVVTSSDDVSVEDLSAKIDDVISRMKEEEIEEDLEDTLYELSQYLTLALEKEVYDETMQEIADKYIKAVEMYEEKKNTDLDTLKTEITQSIEDKKQQIEDEEDVSLIELGNQKIDELFENKHLKNWLKIAKIWMLIGWAWWIGRKIRNFFSGGDKKKEKKVKGGMIKKIFLSILWWVGILQAIKRLKDQDIKNPLDRLFWANENNEKDDSQSNEEHDSWLYHPEQEDVQEYVEMPHASLFNRTADAINIFYTDLIGFSKNGGRWADMFGEASYEKTENNDDAKGISISLLHQAYPTTWELLRSKTLIDQIVISKKKKSLHTFIQSLWLEKAKKFLLPVCEKIDDASFHLLDTAQTVDSFVEWIVWNEETKSAIHGLFRRYIKTISFLTYKQTEFSTYASPQEIVSFSSWTLVETLQLLEEKNILTTPVDDETRSILKQDKEEYNELIDFDDDSWTSILDELETNIALHGSLDYAWQNDLRYLLDNAIGSLHWIDADDWWIQYLPFLDAWDISDDIKQKLWEEMWPGQEITYFATQFQNLKENIWKRIITVDDINELRENINQLFIMKQELTLGSYFTHEIIQNDDWTWAFRIYNAWSQFLDSWKKWIEFILQWDIWSGILVWWSTFIVWINVLRIVPWVNIVATPLAKGVNFWVKKTLQFSWLLVKKSSFFLASRAMPTWFASRYKNNPRLLAHHLIHWRISLEQGLRIAKKNWTVFTNAWAAVQWKKADLLKYLFGSTIDTDLLLKYWNNKNIRKQLFTSSFAGKIYDPRDRINRGKYAYSLGSQSIDKLRRIDAVLESTSGDVQDILKMYIAKTWSLEKSFTFLDTVDTKDVSSMYRILSSKWLSIKQCGTVLSRYIHTWEDVSDLAVFLTKNEPSISHATYFFKNVCKKRPQVQYFANIQKLNTSPSLLWRIIDRSVLKNLDKIKFVAFKKVLENTIEALKKTVLKTNMPWKTSALINRLSTIQNISDVSQLQSACMRIRDISTLKLLGKCFGIVWVVLDWYFLKESLSEARALQYINKNKAVFLEQKAWQQWIWAWVATVAVFIPGPWWIAIALWWVAVIWSLIIESQKNVWSSYLTNYYEYIRTTKQSVVQQIISLQSGKVWNKIDVSWRDAAFWNHFPDRTHDMLASTDGAIKALMWLDSLSQVWGYAQYNDLFRMLDSEDTSDEKKQEAKNVLNAILPSTWYDTLSAFKQQVENDTKKLEEIVSERYNELVLRFWKDWHGNIDIANNQDIQDAMNEHGAIKWIHEYIIEFTDPVSPLIENGLYTENPRTLFFTYTQEEKESFQYLSISDLRKNGEPVYPLERIMFDIAREVYFLDVVTMQGVYSIFTEANKDVYGFYFSEDKKQIYINWDIGFDAWYGIDMSSQHIQEKFVPRLNQTISMKKLITTQSGSGEKIIHEELKKSCLSIIWRHTAVPSSKEEFLQQAIVKPMLANPDTWILPSLSDIALANDIWLTQLRALYKYIPSENTFLVYNWNTDQNLRTILQENNIDVKILSQVPIV